MVYLPTKIELDVGKYTSPMDAMGNNSSREKYAKPLMIFDWKLGPSFGRLIDAPQSRRDIHTGDPG